MSNSAHQIGHCKAKQQKFLCLPAKEAANSETVYSENSYFAHHPGFLIVIYDTSTDLFQAVVLTKMGEYPDISHWKCVAVNTKIELLLLGHSETTHGPFPASARQQPLRWGFKARDLVS